MASHSVLKSFAPVDGFTALDDIKGSDRGNPAVILAAIMKGNGRFSMFDTYDPQMGRTLTAIMESGWVRNNPDVGYPWVVIELTDAGRAQMAAWGFKKWSA